MASIRAFKKDINYVTSELVIECFTLNYLFPEKNQDELASIISDSVNMKLNLLNKINQTRSQNKANKTEMKKLRLEFKNEVESLVGRLSKIPVQ
ncbi:MAG: hypothetical protein CVU09_17595 [Bacteroidetes bacterium HGW-Bacteroidetes-4]|jgi:hypothetical protein|nr:MAG: hypothetical protein CVU09_17595 [Bacteroidetes bacterium HGW-Bacteroidetes-4]